MANPAQMKDLLHKRDREKRKRLIVLVRILTKYLDNTNKFVMLSKVKTIVRECTHRCRMGDTSVSPLHDAIESRLQLVVDAETWTHVILCLELYMAVRRNRTKENITMLKKIPQDAPASIYPGQVPV